MMGITTGTILLACAHAVTMGDAPTKTDGADKATPHAAPAITSLGKSLQPLIDHFNADKDKVRFVTLLSST